MLNFIGPNGAKKFGSRFFGSWAGQTMEFIIKSNIYYAHLFHKKVEKVTPTGVTVKPLYEILTTKDGTLSVEDGWIDSDTKKEINDAYLIRLKRVGQSVVEQMQGLEMDKTKLNMYTLGQMLKYFKSWMIPMIRRRYDIKRENLLLGIDTEGYYITFFRMARDMVLNLKEYGETNWDTFSDYEKANFMATVKELSFMIISTLAVSLIFGFDLDDEDKFKKLKEQSWGRVTALLLLIQLKNETENLSIMPFAGVEHSIVPPIFTESSKLITEPFVGMRVLGNVAKVLQYMGEEYDINMPHYNIEAGDSKSIHYLEKVLQLDDAYYIANPEGKLFTLISMLKK